MDIPVQNTRPAGIFQYKLLSQQGYSSTTYSASRDIPARRVQSIGMEDGATFTGENNVVVTAATATGLVALVTGGGGGGGGGGNGGWWR